MRGTSYIFALLCNLPYVNGMESFVPILSKVMKCFDSGLIFTVSADPSIISGTITEINYGMLVFSVTKWKLIPEMYSLEDQVNKTDMQVLQKITFVFYDSSVL